MPIKCINPTTGEVLAVHELWSKEKADQVIKEVSETNSMWANSTFAERAEGFRSMAGIFRDRSSELARLMAMEMGKPVTQGRSEAEKCAWVCDFYAENAEKFLADEQVQTEARRSFIRYQPLGTILAVMPWNFPFWQLFRFATPAMMAGNTVVLKHASNVTGCALEIENLFREAGFPKNVFRTLIITADDVDHCLRNRNIAAVTLTGSEGAGRSIGSSAGRELKPSVLELGGSDPFVVLGDADIEKASQVGAQSRTLNSGQSCIAAKRFIVTEPVYAQFLNSFVEKMCKLKVDNPLDPSTDVGPLARHDLRDELHAQVTGSISKGAKAVVGGSRPEGPGAFYPVTVLTDVARGMAAYGEEMFGPVASVIKARNNEEAISIANDTQFGLGASLWTSDMKLAESLASKFESGMVFVNSLVKSDPRLPFGGVKTSGYGRELAKNGITEFVNIKTVWIE
jgi:succinate-semialdehyde dehydrogenase / glutarate-semialdehyde dehydrogenase